MRERRFTVLVVDDEANLRSSVQRLLRRRYRDEVEVLFAADGLEALDALAAGPVDTALVDLNMPRMGGFELLERMRADYPSVPVVILTGNGTIKDAVRAVSEGASDFLEKPFEGETVIARLEQFRRIWALEAENRRLREEMAFTFGYEKLVGDSPAMTALKRTIARAGASEESVLILGETGTGKELVARALHFHSARRKGPFVTVDCASLSATVVESELFGYVKGAFTGAAGSAPGLFRSADGGTLFLDEIGELPPGMQIKLLRALQEREVRPVGGVKAEPVDIRVLAATNRDLGAEVARGSFRADLYYRLNVISLEVPPLRARREDIAPLSRFFLERAAPGSGGIGFSDAALRCLEAYAWPGNVRELENVVRRAAALGDGRRIDVDALPPAVAGSGAALPAPEPIGASITDYEEAAVRSALAAAGGNRKKAAAALGMGEATLYRKIGKYGLGVRRSGGGAGG